MRRILLIALVTVILAGCGSADVIPDLDETYDGWCYTLDFTTGLSGESGEIGNGFLNIIAGNGTFTPNGIKSVNGLLDVQYTHNSNVYPEAINAEIEIQTANNERVDVVANLNVFGIQADLQTATRSIETTVEGGPEFADTYSSFASIIVAAPSTADVYIKRIKVGGDGRNPFPSSECTEISTPIPTAENIDLPTPTATLTQLPTDTPMATPTETLTPTPGTPTATPTPDYWVLDVDFMNTLSDEREYFGADRTYYDRALFDIPVFPGNELVGFVSEAFPAAHTSQFWFIRDGLGGFIRWRWHSGARSSAGGSVCHVVSGQHQSACALSSATLGSNRPNLASDMPGGRNIIDIENLYICDRDDNGDINCSNVNFGSEYMAVTQLIYYGIPTTPTATPDGTPGGGECAPYGQTATPSPTPEPDSGDPINPAPLPTCTPTGTPTLTPTLTPSTSPTPTPTATVLNPSPTDQDATTATPLPTATAQDTAEPVTNTPQPTSDGSDNNTATPDQTGTSQAQITPTYNGTPFGTPLPGTGGSDGGIGGVGDGGLGGIGEIGGLGQDFVEGNGDWLMLAPNTVGTIGEVWDDAPIVTPPGLPDCIGSPRLYEICAVYYILENTIFAGPGVVIIPAINALLNMVIFMYVLNYAKAVFRRVKDVLS